MPNDYWGIERNILADVRLDGGWALNLWDRFDIGSKVDIAIIAIALLGMAIIFLLVAYRL